jgi:cytochrome c oxidase assembly protein subunit 15
MWTVTLKLLPVVVMGHLLGGFCTLSLLWWAWLYFQKQPDPLRGIPKYLQACGIIALLVLIGQIALGGWTSANYAALICPDFPTCQGNWWPQMSHKLTAIHMGHRIGALITLLVGIVLCILLWRQPQVWLKRFSLILLGLLLLQVTLGISNIVFYLPLPIALAHHATAAILLLTLLALNFFLYPVNRNRHDLVS